MNEDQYARLIKLCSAALTHWGAGEQHGYIERKFNIFAMSYPTRRQFVEAAYELIRVNDEFKELLADLTIVMQQLKIVAYDSSAEEEVFLEQSLDRLRLKLAGQGADF